MIANRIDIVGRTDKIRQMLPQTSQPGKSPPVGAPRARARATICYRLLLETTEPLQNLNASEANRSVP
jgi:hypothetical protein